MDKLDGDKERQYQQLTKVSGILCLGFGVIIFLIALLDRNIENRGMFFLLGGVVVAMGAIFLSIGSMKNKNTLS